MDDSPPPAYSESYKRPDVDAVNNRPKPAAAVNPNRVENPNVSKGRGSFPRPLPRLPPGPGDAPSLKTGTVSPLRLHKKSQSTTSPSIERPWKPPSFDGAPPSTGWDSPPNPPPFRPRETEFTQPSSSYQKSRLRPEYSQGAGHLPTRDRLPPSHIPGPGVDPGSFYNPAVSGHLSRSISSVSRAPGPATTLNNRPIDSQNNPPRSGRVRWES
ncbi:hypothetical protein C8R47DRAFT_1130665 [Mycena vitilis]|nr:hypothetical protein C8R47DRAFT_1130665 [Mycena vitilis]